MKTVALNLAKCMIARMTIDWSVPARFTLPQDKVQSSSCSKSKVYSIKYPNGQVVFNASDTGHDSIRLHSIRSYPVGQGLGSKMMTEMCKVANKYGVTLELSAMPGSGSKMNRKELIAWYTKFGFSTTHQGLKRLPAVK